MMQISIFLIFVFVNLCTYPCKYLTFLLSVHIVFIHLFNFIFYIVIKIIFFIIFEIIITFLIFYYKAEDLVKI